MFKKFITYISGNIIRRYVIHQHVDGPSPGDMPEAGERRVKALKEETCISHLKPSPPPSSHTHNGACLQESEGFS